jgi:hypothetical protein
MHLRRTVSLAAIAVAANLASFTPSHAQVPECLVRGNWAGWGQNGAGAFDVSPGQACTIGLSTYGRIAQTRVAKQPEHGKVRQMSLSSFEYTPEPGFAGADSFVLEGTGHDPGAPNEASSVTMTVNVR